MSQMNTGPTKAPKSVSVMTFFWRALLCSRTYCSPAT